MVGVDQPGTRILEVASGTGTHAEIVALSLLSREQKPVFVTCDFAEEMVKMLEERFKQSDYSLIPGNAVDIDSATDHTGGDTKVDLDALVAAKGDFRKYVLGYRASGTDLPYPD